MSTLVQFEPLVDSTACLLVKELDNRFADVQGDEGICDLGAWLQYYAFDVIGQLMASKGFGFLEEGRDIDSIIFQIKKMLDYVAPVGFYKP